VPPLVGEVCANVAGAKPANKNKRPNIATVLFTKEISQQVPLY